jgi:vancomycin resistance protein YoaR
MKRLGMLAIMVVLVAAGLLGSWFVLGPYLDGRLVPGVWVWDAPVGGLALEEAQQDVVGGLTLDAPRIVLVGPERRHWSYTPRDLGLSAAAEATVMRAYGPGHRSVGLDAPVERVTLMQEGAVVAPVLVWDQAQALAQLEALAGQINTPAQDAAIERVDGTLTLVEGENGRQLVISPTLAALETALRSPAPVEISLVVEPVAPSITNAEAARALEIAQVMVADPLQLLVSNPKEGDPGPWTLSREMLSQMLRISARDSDVHVWLDEAALTEFLEPLAKALHREPVNARFHFDETSKQLVPIAADRLGRSLDVPATVRRINQQLRVGQHHVSLVLEEVEPRYPETITAAELGIQEQVALGESYFGGSSTARSNNIRLGASKFDGVIVAPGETFSFNEHLGEVTPEEGYDESYVIVGDRTIPGVGGGICQVATTAFRVAYFGGYKIIERWPHAYRVGYYELGGYGPGFDATVYSPLVDFRFVNDTSSHLLIETVVDSARARLQFVFYGTDDGRVVEQIGPTWGEPEPPGPPIYEYDPELSEGTVEKLEGAHDGINAVLERRVHDAEGELLYHDKFVSEFVPWQARYRFGPGYTPPEGVEVVGLEAEP